MGSTDAEFVQRSRRGDREAFGQLVGRHAPGLYRLAVLTLGNPTDAQDVVQDTFLSAYQGLDRFRGEHGDASFRAWLVGIMTRQIARHQRRESYRSTQPLDAHAAPAQRSATAASDARLDVAELLSRLSVEHRQVLVLREIEGLSYDQMAAALGVPRGTVESRLFRARQALRAAAGAE